MADTTLVRAKAYTDDQMQVHLDAANPHPRYSQIVNVQGVATGGRIIKASGTDNINSIPVDRTSVLIVGPTGAAAGIYLANEAGTAWVKLGTGAIPTDTTPPSAPTSLRTTSVISTAITIAWNASTDPDSGIAGYEVAQGATGPFIPNGNSLSKAFTGLNPSTSYTFRVRAQDNAGNLSTVTQLTVSTTAASDTNPPGSPPNFRASAVGQTSITLAWDAATDTGGGTVARYEVSQDSTSTYTSVGLALTTTRSSLQPSTSYTFRVRAVDTSSNVSPAAVLTLTTSGTVITTTTLVGVSDSDENHGGYTGWDVWRTYDQNENRSRANQTGTGKPKRLAFTDGGSFKSGYQGTYDRIVTVLEDFYYGSGSAERTGVRLDVANGNEYAADVSAAQIPAFVEGCRGIYEATRRLNTNGTRRYPLAEAWLDPTQNQEQQSEVQASLHPAARWVDGIAWSMYPPGRGQVQAEWSDPRFDKPSLNEADRTNLQIGFMIRCFYRTKQAVLQARTDTGNPNFKVQIACWEIGIGDDPSDNTHRPYYIVHSMVGTAYKLTQQYSQWISGLPVFLYWDQEKAAGGPENILSDEPTSTNPSSATALRNWQQYNHELGGTHPASWPAGPKSSWPTGA